MSAITVENQPTNPEPERIKFRLGYIGLPLALLVIAVVLVAVYYGRLPDPVAYRFQTADAAKFVSRGAMAAWLIVPHIVCAFMSWALVSIILLSSKYWADEGSFIARVLPLMGNMTAVAQIVFVLAAVQIFVYNTAGKLLAPFWPVAVAVLVIGGAVIFFKFISLYQAAKQHKPKPVQEQE